MWIYRKISKIAALIGDNSRDAALSLVQFMAGHQQYPRRNLFI